MSRAPSKRTTQAEPADAAEAPRVPHPAETLVLEGHEQAEALFLQAHARGKLHHAWLLTGEQGIGKATFAYAAARYLLSGHAGNEAPAPPRLPAATGDSPVARRIAASAHPSLFVLERTAKRAGAKPSSTIAVDDVRRLMGFLRLTSSTESRVIIVDTADDLTGASANALLKAVEEPPSGAMFFLISQSSGGVLPTIRSRCVKLHLRPLAPEPLHRAVLAACKRGGLAEPDAQAWREVESLAAGSPGRALSLLASNRLELTGKVNALISSLPRLDHQRLHALIAQATGSSEDGTFETVCDVIEEALERRLRETLGRNDSGGSGGPRLADQAELWEKMRARRREMEALNLDKAAFLFQTFADLASAGRNPESNSLPSR